MEHWVNVIVTEVIIGLTSSAIVGCIDVAQLSPLTTTRYVKTKWLYSIHSCATTHRDFFFPYQIGIYVNCFEADRNARLANWLNAGQGTFSLFMSSFFAGSSPSHPPLLQETLTYVVGTTISIVWRTVFEESEKRFNDDGLLVRYARAMTSLTTDAAWWNMSSSSSYVNDGDGDDDAHWNGHGSRLVMALGCEIC